MKFLFVTPYAICLLQKWIIVHGSLQSVKKASQARDSHHTVHLLNANQADGMPINEGSLARFGSSPPILATSAWTPYTVHAANIQKLSKLYQIFYSSCHGDISSLSMGSLGKLVLKGGDPIYTLSICGEIDMELLLNHLCRAIEQVAEVVSGDVELYVHFHYPTGVLGDDEVAEGLSQELGFTQIRPSLGDYQYNVLEVGLLYQPVVVAEKHKL